MKGGKATPGGDGNVPILRTAHKDVAWLLAHVPVHSPASWLQNQVLRLEGDRVVRFLLFLAQIRQ
jgi:hypothetical protein